MMTCYFSKRYVAAALAATALVLTLTPSLQAQSSLQAQQRQGPPSPMSADLTESVVQAADAAGTSAQAASALVTAAKNAISEEQKLTASDRGEGDNFGWSVSIDGDRALIGALREEFAEGAAYVFDFDGTTWNETIKLKASDPAVNDFFGRSVSLDGDRALIGAPDDDDLGGDSGSAYVFEFDGSSWNETAKLTASDGLPTAFFGFAVSLDGDRALIGAQGDDEGGSASGSAYIFDFDGSSWREAAKLTASDADDGDRFGRAVSIDGDRALIGAPFDDDPGNDFGSAYIFDFDGSSWSETVKLTHPDGGAEVNRFAFGVSLSGDRALIGVYGDSPAGEGSGSAYIFEFDGSSWNEAAELIASDGSAGDAFGWAVSLDGNRALIGAHADDDDGNSSGSAYIFDFNGNSWVEATKLTASDASEFDDFGLSVSIDGDRALIGADRDDDGAGAAYAVIPPPIDAEASPEQRPEAFALSPVYPNPAPLASEARVRISLTAEATVRLEVFDVLGRRLAPAATSRLAGGREQELAVPTGSLPAGSYVLRVTQSGAAGTSVQVRRFTVVR